MTTVVTEFAKRIFLAGHSEGWTGNQGRRDVQHVDAEKGWSLFVENGALAKAVKAIASKAPREDDAVVSRMRDALRWIVQSPEETVMVKAKACAALDAYLAMSSHDPLLRQLREDDAPGEARQERQKVAVYLRRQGQQGNRHQPTVPVAASELLKAADMLEAPDAPEALSAVIVRLEDCQRDCPAGHNNLSGRLTAIRETLKAVVSKAPREDDAVARQLREALVDHNDALRSACQVADRDGRDTNWKTLRGHLHWTLAEHHEITNEARALSSTTPRDG